MALYTQKTCKLLREIVLYILNTPGKPLEKAQKTPWKTLDFLNYESVRTLSFSKQTLCYVLEEVILSYYSNKKCKGVLPCIGKTHSIMIDLR